MMKTLPPRPKRPESNLAIYLAQHLLHKSPFTKVVYDRKEKYSYFMELVEKEILTVHPDPSKVAFVTVDVSQYDSATHAREEALKSIFDELINRDAIFSLIKLLPKELRHSSSMDGHISALHQLIEHAWTPPNDPGGFLHALGSAIESCQFHLILIIKGLDKFDDYATIGLREKQKTADPLLSFIYFLEKENSISTVIIASSKRNIDSRRLPSEDIRLS